MYDIFHFVMTYDSPATIRRRQVAAENRAPKRTRRAAASTKVLTNEQWSATCDFHITEIHNKSIYPDSVSAHARALVHMAIERRAAEIQRDLGRAYWKAILVARHELLNTEVA
jgi:hypothetical protein